MPTFSIPGLSVSLDCYQWGYVSGWQYGVRNEATTDYGVLYREVTGTVQHKMTIRFATVDAPMEQLRRLAIRAGREALPVIFTDIDGSRWMVDWPEANDFRQVLDNRREVEIPLLEQQGTVAPPLFQFIPAGSIAFSGYGDFYMKFASFDGTVYPQPANAPYIGATGEQSACNGLRALPGTAGYVTFSDSPDPDFDPYHSAYTLDRNFNPSVMFGVPTTPPYIGVYNTGMTMDAAGNVYGVASNKFVYRVNPATGVETLVATLSILGPTGAAGRMSLGVTPDGTLLYWSFKESYLNGGQPGVRKHSLVTNTDLGMFVTAPSLPFTETLENSLLVLANGDVIVGWRMDKVRRYNAAGVELMHYTLPSLATATAITILPDVNRAAALPLPDVETSFIVQYYADRGDYGVSVARFQTDTGALLDLFEDHGGQEPAKDGEFGWFEWDGSICLTRVPLPILEPVA